MEPRGSAAVALPISNSPETHSHFDRRRSTSRSNSHSSTTSIHQQGEAMAIPRARRLSRDIPPPLPPPRQILELEKDDLGYRFAQLEQANNGPLRSLKEGSSLLGGSYPRPVAPQYKDRMDVDKNDSRERSGSASTIKQRSPGKSESSGRLPGVVRRPTSPSSILHGERPLAQENLNRSNQAYDQAVLSKIGKSNSPPRHLSDSSDSPVLTQKLSLQTKEVKPLQQQSTPNEKSATTVDSGSRWPTSPASTAGASPFSRSNYYGSVPRSPTNDVGTGPMVLDPELFVPRSTHPSLTTGVAHPGVEEIRSRSGRNSYDQAMYTPASETTDAMSEEPCADRKMSKQGMKRKSPPCEGQPEERPRPELYPKLATLASGSPNAKYALPHGSVSSTASSAQRSSYISSTPLSAAPSSMTSISSFETQSPRDFITSAHPVSSPVTLIAPRKNHDKIIPRKMSAQQTQEIRPAPARIGNHYICSCCPKKPKKFETEEQLRAHESEKQYSCHFCSNRFKNKNEAERHQNSLHLRRHSWSCAALVNYEAAFSPLGAVDSNSATMDACGYCGEEFPNHPQPDWERRIDHLTNVHKFGECNSAKKFFRADHFRQHLKHSHAGRSGKWTNILEHACVRDEIPLEPAGFPMVTGEQPGIPVRSSNMLSAQVNGISAAATTVGRSLQDK